MSSATQETERTAELEQEFAHYPDNSLGQQYREFHEVPSLFEVVFAHFKAHNL